MLKILFLTSFVFVYNFFEVEIPHGNDGILKKSNNEYITVFNDPYNSESYTIKVEYDNVTFLTEKRNFARENIYDEDFDILIIDSNLIFYALIYSIVVDNNGKTNEAFWRNFLLNIRFQAQAYSNDCLVVCSSINYFDSSGYTYYYYLHLLEAPYIEFYKELEIEKSTKYLRHELIGLKDYFVFITIDEVEENKGNITYRFLDFELNLVNSLTNEYEDYLDIYFSKLSNNGELNEFLFCILKKEDSSENLKNYKCQVVKYENNGLSPLQTIDIPISGYTYTLEKYFFDGNKIVFYIYDIRNDNYIDSYIPSNYINILQYENHFLSFYKNFKNCILPRIARYDGMFSYCRLDFAMTEQSPVVIFNRVFYYILSICVPKTITLKANQKLEFPIEEFIFPGIDTLRFSLLVK